MKSLLSLTALAISLTGVPVMADAFGGATGVQADMVSDWMGAEDSFDRRGRSRGRGGDDRAGDDRRGGGGHGGRPRIPGGSGCDDPGDIVEHPECRV